MTDQHSDKHWRKKPVVIEAVQWHQYGDHPEVQPHGYGLYDPHSLVTCGACNQPMFFKDSLGGMGRLNFTHGFIKTLESIPGSAHLVCPGDWIIKGVKGEHYACKPDIFAATYEPASTPPPPVAALPSSIVASHGIDKEEWLLATSWSAEEEIENPSSPADYTHNSAIKFARIVERIYEAAPQETTPSGGQEKTECTSPAQRSGHIVPESDLPAGVAPPSARAETIEAKYEAAWEDSARWRWLFGDNGANVMVSVKIREKCEGDMHDGDTIKFGLLTLGTHHFPTKDFARLIDALRLGATLTHARSIVYPFPPSAATDGGADK